MERIEDKINESVSITDLLAIVEKNRQGILRRLGLKGADREGIMRELDKIPDDVLQGHLPELEKMLENEIRLSTVTVSPTGGPPMIGNTEIITDTKELLHAINKKLRRVS